MNAPKLRFNGFKEDWKIFKLNSLMSFNNGINAEKDSYGHGRKFINVLDILNNNYITYNDIIGSVSVTEKVEETNKVEYGDLLFLRSSETREDVGKSSVYLDKNEFALFGGFVIRGKKQSEYNPYFLKLNLESPKVRNQISSKAGGSTRFNVSQSILSSIEISIPEQNEQEKIATFISHLDKKIHLQQTKIGLLKEQKKGYMQKIFSQELRFKDEDGQKFPEWDSNIKAGKLFESISNKNHNGNIPVLSATQDNGMVYRNTLERHMAFKNENLKSYKLVEKNDFIISLRSFQGGIEISSLKGLVSPAYTVFRKKSKKIHDLYFSIFFKTESFIKRLNSTTYGIRDGKAISYKDFSALKFNVPCLKEQKKIAEFLHLIDKKIQHEQNKLDSLQQQKQAFMQQMFI